MTFSGDFRTSGPTEAETAEDNTDPGAYKRGGFPFEITGPCRGSIPRQGSEIHKGRRKLIQKKAAAGQNQT